MTLTGRIDRWEASGRSLALLKLANVGLVTIWGFIVTYVFVRILPLSDFRAFLILIAFSNFAISAEFGITQIAYGRLRRHWLGAGGEGEGDLFSFEEIGLLFSWLCGLLLIGTLAVAAALATRLIPSSVPVLFLLFFLTSALNVVALLVKRALAAVDRNFLWEALDLARRVVSIGLLAAILMGLDAHLSVALQFVLSVIGIGAGMAILQARVAMRARQWVGFRLSDGAVKGRYLRQAGTSALLTLSEISAYNAPYFTIAIATRDARAMLLFDFAFKLSRALSAFVRATVEAALPRISSAYFAGRAADMLRLLRRALLVAVGMASIGALILLVAGPTIFGILFDHRAAIGEGDVAMIAAMQVALSVTCVSVYVQGALNRFAPLLHQSLPFLIGSLLSVPIAAAFARGPAGFASLFLLLYLMTFMGTALLHMRSLRTLLRDVARREAQG